jgi:hypothetical protein
LFSALLSSVTWPWLGLLVFEQILSEIIPPGSYGWGIGSSGQVWKDGSCTNNYALKNLTKQGDTVELVLDCDAAKLSLHLSTGQQFHIEIPKSQTWRLHVNLSAANDKVRIIDDNV